jgi:hypothetical protein
MKKPRLITIPCRRGCGKELTTLSRSMWGMDDAVRQKYQGICHDCLTRKERYAMLDAMGKQLAINLQREAN